jgi:peptide chain release factor 1
MKDAYSWASFLINRITMIDQASVDKLTARLAELEAGVARPEIYASPKAASLVHEQRDFQTRLELFQDVQKTETDLEDAKALTNDPEMGELARAEIPELEAKLEGLQGKVRTALVPIDPNDNKTAIIEIRAGAGGDESSLFAGELARMYARFAEAHGLKLTMLSESPNEVGGYKEVIMTSGPQAYGQLKYESGVHRVQRVPLPPARCTPPLL